MPSEPGSASLKDATLLREEALVPRTRVVEIDCGPGGLAVKAYLLMGAHPVLVDTGVTGSSDHILAALAREGYVPRDLALIVLTHGHLDHTGCARELSERCDAPVAVHASEAPHVRAGTSAPVTGRSALGKLLASVTLRSDEMAAPHHVGFEPDIVLRGGESLEEWGVDATVLHTPGHTDGSISVLLDGGDVLVGDLLSRALLHRGTPAPGMFAVDSEAMDASIRRILGLTPSLTYASHSRPFPLSALRAAFA